MKVTKYPEKQRLTDIQPSRVTHQWESTPRPRGLEAQAFRVAKQFLTHAVPPLTHFHAPFSTFQSRIASDLKDLRDQSVFSFFMVNALFVVIVFLLQLNKDKLHIRWPFGVKTNITFNEATQEVSHPVQSGEECPPFPCVCPVRTVQ